MSDLKNPRAIWTKGFLFLAIAVISATLLLLDTPTLRFAALLTLCVWSACRFYYFAFYVIEHYVDSEYRFAGLVDFVVYLFGRHRADEISTRSHRNDS